MNNNTQNKYLYIIAFNDISNETKTSFQKNYQLTFLYL
jgi:hypothetical protein